MLFYFNHSCSENRLIVLKPFSLVLNVLINMNSVNIAEGLLHNIYEKIACAMLLKRNQNIIWYLLIKT